MYTYNPFTGKLDDAGQGADDVILLQEDFCSASPISEGTYFAKVATIDLKAGRDVGHNCIAMFHVMRCLTMPYSYRSRVTVQEATIYVSVSSIHIDGHKASIVLGDATGISSDDIVLIRTSQSETNCQFTLYVRIFFKDRLFFFGRWNQLDKDNVTLTTGTIDDSLVGGFDPSLPTYHPTMADNGEYPVENVDTITITHKLNKYPSVTIIDADGDVVLADIHHASRSELTVTFTETFTGTIILN